MLEGDGVEEAGVDLIGAGGETPELSAPLA